MFHCTTELMGNGPTTVQECETWVQRPIQVCHVVSAMISNHVHISTRSREHINLQGAPSAVDNNVILIAMDQCHNLNCDCNHALMT